MSIRRCYKLIPAALFVFLTTPVVLLATQAHADSEYPNLDAACANNPEYCEQAREKMAAKCQEDPAGCAEKKAKLDKKMGELKAKCEANPEVCAEKKEKMRKRMADIKAKCEADPATCEEKKAKLRERIEQRLEN